MDKYPINESERPVPELPAEGAEPDTGENGPDTLKKQSAGCLAILSYVALILGVSIFISVFAVFAANDMFAFVKGQTEAVVTVDSSMTAEDVAKELKKNGIIRYPSLFVFFANSTDMADRIAPGEYVLSASMDYRTLLSKMRIRSTGPETVRIVVPEGMEQDDIFEMLEEEGVCEAWRLRGVARYYDFDYAFLNGLPYEEKRLEGYLFPDTYEFYKDDDPVRVIRRLLANFNRKLTVDMKSRAENIEMSMHDIIIIASMIEREAKFDDERPTISSVIHNRLQNSGTYPKLQIDATVIYALGEHKEILTESDLAVDSPYNTYRVDGLPYGPISNPGIAAIRAALYPEDTDCFYYNARPNGYHYFSKNSAEHQANIGKAALEDSDTPHTPVSQ